MTRKICPVCHGKGEIRNPKGELYRDYIDCPNCGGEGFVGIPDNIDAGKYRKRYIQR